MKLCWLTKLLHSLTTCSLRKTLHTFTKVLLPQETPKMFAFTHTIFFFFAYALKSFAFAKEILLLYCNPQYSLTKPLDSFNNFCTLEKLYVCKVRKSCKSLKGCIYVTLFKWPNSNCFAPMWHRLDMIHEHVSRKKAYGFQYSQIGFQASFVCGNKSDITWIRAFASAM